MKKKPIGIYFRKIFLKTRKKSKNIKVFLMAGGKGKRLNPYTLKTPKPMLIIDKKPMLYYVLKNYFSQGFNNFYISVNFRYKQITDYFKDGSFLGVKISYIKEKKPLGTAGSLGNLKYQNIEDVLVSNCDIMTDINYSSIIDFHKKFKADVTMAVKSSILQSQFGVIENNGIRIKSIKEKPKITQYVNAGIYIFKGSILNKIKNNRYLNMNSLLSKLIDDKKKVILYPLYESWIDLGTHKDLNYYKNIKIRNEK